jgi:hypothetical protein
VSPLLEVEGSRELEGKDIFSEDEKSEMVPSASRKTIRLLTRNEDRITF